MEDSLILDALNRIGRHSDQLDRTINTFYEATQRRKASETPGRFRVTTSLINGQVQSFQMVPNNPLRKRLIIINNGPDDVLFDYKPFESNQAVQMAAMLNGSIVAQAQVTTGIIVATGPNTTIETAGSLHVMNFVKTGDLAGAALTVIEEVYEEVNVQDPSLIGLDGLQHQGYDFTGLKNIK